MIFSEKFTTKLTIVILLLIACLLFLQYAFALNLKKNSSPLTQAILAKTIAKSAMNPCFSIVATADVVKLINDFRNNAGTRAFLHESISRMQNASWYIDAALKANNMPNDLKVIPLALSGYQPLSENENPVKAAGIWQLMPETGKKLGLTMDNAQDERLNLQKSTNAALQYLKSNKDEFHNWELAIFAYAIGERNLETLIVLTGLHDPQALADSPYAPRDLKPFVTRLNALLIIMHNPQLI